MDKRLEWILGSAEHHGNESGNEYEIGDLQEAVKACWLHMNPHQQRSAYEYMDLWCDPPMDEALPLPLDKSVQVLFKITSSLYLYIDWTMDALTYIIDELEKFEKECLENGHVLSKRISVPSGFTFQWFTNQRGFHIPTQYLEIDELMQDPASRVKPDFHLNMTGKNAFCLSEGTTCLVLHNRKLVHFVVDSSERYKDAYGEIKSPSMNLKQLIEWRDKLLPF